MNWLMIRAYGPPVPTFHSSPERATLFLEDELGELLVCSRSGHLSDGAGNTWALIVERRHFEARFRRRWQ